MLQFSKDFYKDEEREGFLIKSMVKRSWASQMDVLNVINEICDRHGIQYFAFWGTMLGAVRHKGFVPWDDDMDIIMKRDDYDRFIDIVRDELPEGYMLLSIYSEQEWDTVISRIVNSYSIDYNEEYLLKHHGFPYVCGIDIFPYDYLPDDKETFDYMENILSGAAQAKSLYLKIEEAKANNKAPDEKDVKKLDIILSDLEKRLDFKFDRETYLQNQLLCLFDSAGSSYGNKSSKFISCQVERRKREDAGLNFTIPSYLLEEAIDYPFEGYTVRIPKYYEICLSKCYGKNFMTPVRGASAHDYPFYLKQEEAVRNLGQLEDLIESVENVQDRIGTDSNESYASGAATPECDSELAGLVKDWKGTDKKAVLCCFSTMDACETEEKFIKKLKDTVEFFKNQTDRVCFILLEAPFVEEILLRESEELAVSYREIINSVMESDWALVIYPEQYNEVVDMCDAYYGSANEYIKPFQLSKRPIMVQNIDITNA